MTAFYIAASFDQRKRLKAEVMIPLLAAGYTVTSRWLGMPDKMGALVKPEDRLREAHTDLDDIDAADAVVVFTTEPSTTGGYHVEFGYALAQGKDMILVGPVLNIFHSLTAVKRFETQSEFLAEYCPVLTGQ